MTLPTFHEILIDIQPYEILILIASLDQGGSETQAVLWAIELQKHNKNVCLIAYSFRGFIAQGEEQSYQIRALCD
jgi:hypothetical protein